MIKIGIDKIEVYRVTIPLDTPFVISLGAIEKLDQIIVKIVTDKGEIGWGEAAASRVILGESPSTIQAALGIIAPQLIGEDPTRIEPIIKLMDEAISSNTAAKAGLDIALHDLIGNMRGEPVWKMLGGAHPSKLETDFTVTIDEPAEMAKAAKNLVNEGFRVIKVKVGTDPDGDVLRLVKIREAVESEVAIRIDANQGWTRQEAVSVLRKTEDLNIQFAEQPIKAGDIDGLSLIREKVNVPVMADETVHNPEDAMEAIKEEAVDYINIKLMKAGGFWKAKKVSAVAEAAHVGCMVGSMVATDLAGTAATHLAGALDNVIFRDLDAGSSLETPLIKRGGSKLVGDKRILPNTPGLGIEKIDKNLLGEPIDVYS